MNDPSGEICDDCRPLFERLHDRNVGLEVTLRSQAGIIGRNKREDDDLSSHVFWDRAQRLFKVWQRATGHTKSRWSKARFRECVETLETYEDEVILRAIEGLAFDPWITRRKNGTEQRHDGWHLLWKESTSIEEYANKAPMEWRGNLIEHAEGIEGWGI